MRALKSIFILSLLLVNAAAHAQDGLTISDSIAKMNEIDKWVRLNVQEKELTKQYVEKKDCKTTQKDSIYDSKNTWITGYYRDGQLIRISVSYSEGNEDVMNEEGHHYTSEYFFKDGQLVYADFFCMVNEAGSCGFHTSSYGLYFSDDIIVGYSEDKSHDFYVHCTCTLPGMAKIIEGYSPEVLKGYMACLD